MRNKDLKSQILINSVTLFLAGLCGYFFGRLVFQSFDPKPLSDFHVYYYIPKAVLALVRPEHPYTNFTPIYPYFYPPASFFVFYPLLFFKFYAAKIIWTLLNTILLISSVYIVTKLLANKSKVIFFLLLLSAIKFIPVRFTMIDGQFNIILLFIYTYGLYSLVKNKNSVGGFLLGLGIITKISPALIAIYAFYKRKFRLVLFIVLTVTLFAILAEIFIEKGINFYYVRYVIDNIATQSKDPSWRDQSLLGFLKRFTYPEYVSVFGIEISKTHLRSLISYSIIGAILGLFGLLDLKLTKSKMDIYVSYFILTVIAFVGTGLAWFHQYTIMLLPLWGIFMLGLFWVKGKTGYLLSLSAIAIYFYCNQNLEPVKNVFVQPNMFYSGVILLFLLVFIKIKPDLIRKTSKIFLTTPSKVNNAFLVATFIFMFTYSLNLFNIPGVLREYRDKARIANVNFMGEVLINKPAQFEKGASNSFIKTEKLDEGYILFKENEESKIRKYMSILYLDPINNEKYNYAFESNGVDFILSARLESEKYKKKYGERYLYVSTEKEPGLEEKSGAYYE